MLVSTLEEFLKKLKCQMGIPVGQAKLNTLLFTDDNILITEEHEDNSMLKTLHEEYLIWVIG